MARRSAISTGDIDIQDANLTIGELGDGQGITRDDIEIVQPRDMMNRADEEKFMNEFVVINIEPDDDPNAPEFLYCGHQGISQWVHRGNDQRIRRKYLYALIAGKKTQFACNFGRDNSGNEYNRLNGKRSTTYRLSVVEDTPEGRRKFAQWMREP